jgi:hypothetical protein
MDLALSRLSLGACEQTASDASQFQLQSDGVPTLRVDDVRYRKLVSQLGAALAPAVLAPVTTGGPKGFDLRVETNLTGISAGADYWQRGSQGRGGDAVPTCDGRNRDVRPVLTQSRVAFAKGLPLGVSIGASFGKLHHSSLWTAGGELKLALVEGLRQLWAPDVAVRFAAQTLVGDAALALTTLGADLILSKGVPFRSGLQLAPYGGAGVYWLRGRTGHVDLTPNVDATACAAGRDPICNAQGLGASRADLGHDQAFADVTLDRYRAFMGLWLRYRLVALAAELMLDLVAPGTADGQAGRDLPRQWSVHLAPSLSF